MTLLELNKLKVLILDDDKIVTGLLEDILLDHGIDNFKVFNSPKIALEKLEFFTPNLILSDIEMDEINGFEFIQQAREKHPKMKQAAVLFLTGHSSPEMIKKAKELRVAGYLLKPIQVDKFKASLIRIYKALISSGKL